MIAGAVVLRPEPGNGATATALAAAGVNVLRCPLFAVEPVAWEPPDVMRFDALLLTSANAPRYAGAKLSRLQGLPVLAVGEATAAAARAAGLRVILTGDRDAESLLAAQSDDAGGRLLHLAGHDRVTLPGVEAITVYRSVAVPLSPGAARAWEGRVALLHSPRAARRFAELVDLDAAPRAAVGLVALSPAVLAAAGPGWAEIAVAATPTDAALVTEALALIDRHGGRVDKCGR